MLQKYGIGIIAIILAVSAVAFTTPPPAHRFNPKTLTYYFEFTGAHHDESDVSQWQEISLSSYNALPCNATSQGCKIATTAVSNPTASFPDREISSVTVNSNDVPQQTMDNVDVANKP